MTPDVNVLFAASRSDHPHHEAARAGLEKALADVETGASFTLMPMVLASLLRFLTSPKVFVHPTPLPDAADFIDALMSTPGVQLASVGPEWPRLRQLCLDKHLAGNALPDAWLAPDVEQHAEHLVSFDRDFKKLLPRVRFTLLMA